MAAEAWPEHACLDLTLLSYEGRRFPRRREPLLMQKDNSLQRQIFVSLFEMFLAYKGIFKKPEAAFIQKIKAARMLLFSLSQCLLQTSSECLERQQKFDGDSR